MGLGLARERVSGAAGGEGAGAGRERLAAQLAFLLEIDRVKQVLRHNPLADGSRRENDAEHMWHLSVMAVVLAEHAAEPVDLARVLTMVVLHDVVEIDTGDVLFYDDAGREAVAAAEQAAAARIFGLLPADQGEKLRALWEEFEARQSADARFAAAVDRLHPLLLNRSAGGGAWTGAG
ncbi:MAG: HD domain-containing protein, partial [Acidimicrobiales bacterium]